MFCNGHKARNQKGEIIMLTSLEKLFDTSPFLSYPVPISSRGNVEATYKDGVYTAIIDCAGADKSKFNVRVTKSNELVVSYPSTEGYRCRSFTYYFPLNSLSVVGTEASYVDGVLTIKLSTQKPTDTTHTIHVH